MYQLVGLYLTLTLLGIGRLLSGTTTEAKRTAFSVLQSQSHLPARLLVAGDENVTLQGRWAKGPAYAVAVEGSHVSFGDGAEFISATINSSGETFEQGGMT